MAKPRERLSAGSASPALPCTTSPWFLGSGALHVSGGPRNGDTVRPRIDSPVSERVSLGRLLRTELAPTPGRARHALLTAAATAVALGIAVALQVGSFVAPAMAYIAMQPTVTCTWRNLLRRVLTCALSMTVLIHLGGFVVQLPWLLLPVFFLEISAVSYFVSLTRRPLEALAVMYGIVMVHFTGIFAPHAIGTVGLEVVSAYAIGTAVGTAFAQLVSRERPHERLAAALADSFAGARARLAAVAATYLDAAPASAPAPPSLADHLQLFELTRQEELGGAEEAVFLAVMIAAERAHLALTVADSLSVETVDRRYRVWIRPELEALIAPIDTALAGFAAAAAGLAHGPWDPVAHDWPDLPVRVRALEQRQLDLRHRGALEGIDIAEAANTNAFVQTLRSLADVMRIAPAELARTVDAADTSAAAPLWPTARRFDPYAARWAIQVGLAVTLTFLVIVMSHVPALFTALWNPLFIAQSSYGATVRKAGLRVAGVVLGGVLAVLTVVAVMPNITSVGALMLAFFAVIAPCQYLALGGPRVSYAGMQTAFTYMIVLVATQPTVDISAVLWRAFGTLLGTACLFGVFRVIAPDYAGRQIVARFRDVLRAILALWPEPGATRLTPARLLEVRREVGTGTADVLRLAEEARIEHRDGGVAPAAAVDAAGLASRIAHRSVLIHRGRLSVAWPPLPEPTRAGLLALEAALRARLLALLAVLDARHTMAPVGSRAFTAACSAAAALTAAPLPALEAPVQQFTAGLDAVRTTALADWPPAASTALFAEDDHLRRVADLLPRLEAALRHALLPDGARP